MALLGSSRAATAAPHRLAVRGQGLEARPHERCDPLADAHRRQRVGVDPRQHLAVGPALELRQEIVAAARKQAPHEAGLDAEVAGAGRQRPAAPAVERHMDQGRLEQAVTLVLAARDAHPDCSSSSTSAAAKCLSSLSKLSCRRSLIRMGYRMPSR